MTEGADQLHAAATRQIGELIDLVSTLDAGRSRLPCPGREKLGDGTVAANAQHAADNYQRIAAFVATSGQVSAAHPPAEYGAHRMPGFVRRLGHQPTKQDEHRAGPDVEQYAADSLDPGELVKQLSVTCDALAQIATLTDSQLEAIPPDGSFRFCDGQRTLQQVLTSLLKHQSHQVEAVKAALA
jgi:hypothetical protein